MSTQPIKISVYGSQHSDYHRSQDALESAVKLGTTIAEHDVITTVPAQPGFSHWVAKGAQQADGHVIGFSPASSEQEHTSVYGLPLKYMDVIIYSGFGFAGSDLLLSRSSDAVIFGYGGVETIHEFWVAFQEDKPIGVLKGPWSVDELLHDLLKTNPEFNHDQIVFDDDPVRLVEQLIKKAKQLRVENYHL